MNKLKYCWVFVLLGLLACTDTDPRVFELNETISIGVSESITLQLPQQDEYIDLMVLDIEESRCPANANCVRFGEARVTVGVNGIEEILKTLNLCVGDCPERGVGVIQVDTIAVELDNNSYAVLLKDVTPYPTTDNNSLPKQALLEVIKL